MDAKTFLRDYGKAEAELVAAKAGTKLIYLEHLAAGHRRPSPRLAKRLAEASGGRMDVLSLLYPPKTDFPLLGPAEPRDANRVR